jgi:hypothetical protein
MKERPGTWGEVGVGVTLLSPTGLPLICTRFERGWYLMEDRNHHKRRVEPKPPTAPVMILETTPEEAEALARELLGAHNVLDAETDRRVEQRQHQWVVPHFPRKGERDALTRARDHVDWYHGTYSGNAQYAGGFKTLAEITAAHDEMHTPGQVFTDRPHVHDNGE